MSALITASAEGFDDIVEKLIRKGVEIDATTAVRNDVATYIKRYKCVRLRSETEDEA